MKIKNVKGFVGVDIVIGILAVFIFSTLIISLMYNNFLENLKIKKDAMAAIYLTEIFESIAIEDYDNISQENILNLVSSDLEEKGYDIVINVDNEFEFQENKNEDILKKITATISYEIGDKRYERAMDRIKVKE